MVWMVDVDISAGVTESAHPLLRLRTGWFQEIPTAGEFEHLYLQVLTLWVITLLTNFNSI